VNSPSVAVMDVDPFDGVISSDDEEDKDDNVDAEEFDDVEEEDAENKNDGNDELKGIDAHGMEWKQVESVDQCEHLKKCPRQSATVHYSQINANAYLPGVGVDVFASNASQRQSHPLFYFLLMFPLAYVDSIVSFTNSSMRDNQRSMDSKSLFIVLGLLLAMTLQRLPNKRDYWQKSESELFPSPDFGRFMHYSHFSHFLRHLVFGDGNSSIDPWAKVRGFLDAINLRNRQVITPGTFVVMDESMIGWLGIETITIANVLLVDSLIY
jgi:hypothetical protein